MPKLALKCFSILTLRQPRQQIWVTCGIKGFP